MTRSRKNFLSNDRYKFIVSKGFTLVEIIGVVVIIAIIASFAIASFEKRMMREAERNAILKLNGMMGRLDIYKAKHNRYPDCSSCNEEDQIVAALGMPFEQEPFDVSCHFETAQYDCHISYPIGDWNKRKFQLHVSSADFNIRCSTPPVACSGCECPSCTSSGCP